MLTITIIAGRESFLHDICLFYRASLGGPDERREQKFATLVGDHFEMSPTNILLTPIYIDGLAIQKTAMHTSPCFLTVFGPCMAEFGTENKTSQ
ncbi:hypothetical protein DI43_06050 [Geobacillus sp. CAMR12739]|nr:hypothetical protein DI43_06050 [Geobacillus sp. CAMR12739]